MGKVKKTQRQGMVADEIQRELAGIVNNALMDPRVKTITISEVSLTRDLGIARVYVTTLEDSKKEDMLFALNGASGFLRTKLASKIKLKYIPKLEFFYDHAIENGRNMERLIACIKNNDNNSISN